MVYYFKHKVCAVNTTYIGGSIGFTVAHLLVCPEAAGENGIGASKNGHCEQA